MVWSDYIYFGLVLLNIIIYRSAQAGLLDRQM